MMPADSRSVQEMRGDKRRTYRFQDDVVADHITGKSMQASKAMKGYISAFVALMKFYCASLNTGFCKPKRTVSCPRRWRLAQYKRFATIAAATNANKPDPTQMSWLYLSGRNAGITNVLAQMTASPLPCATSYLSSNKRR
jgi:hypothetical protein